MLRSGPEWLRRRLEGREEGLQKGRIQGEKIGTIHFCQRLLNLPETATAELAALSIEELTRRVDNLQQQVLKQP
jgi:hypothetical protein